MNAVIPFPADRCHRPARTGAAIEATVIIFPGVSMERVERADDNRPAPRATTPAALAQLREDFGEA